MRKHLSVFALFTFVFLCAQAQKGNNAVSINAEAGIPFFQNDRGFGIFIKGLYGVGSAAQLTLSAGFYRFSNKNKIEEGEVNTRLIPFLAGYRQNIHHFFIEPQIGVGELGGRIKPEGDYARPSVAAIFGGAMAGYSYKQFTAGLHFQTAHSIEGESAGIWHDKNFHYTGIFIGYNLFYK